MLLLKPSIKHLFLFLFLFIICGVKAQNIREFSPETDTKHATLNCYSQVTGEFQRLFLRDGEWIVSTEVPQPPINITKGALVMEFTPETSSKFATMNIYSQETGEFQRLVLKEGVWIVSTGIPQPPINVAKGSIVMEFSAETNTKFATINIYSRETGEFQRLVLKEGVWIVSSQFQ